MKKLLTLILLTALFMGCSSDDDNETQDYTSFTVMQNTIEIQPNTVVGYKKDGKYYKVADLGDLKKGVPSSEVKLTDNSITEIYVFTDYNGGVRLNIIFSLRNNLKNVFLIPESTGGIGFSDKTDPTQYPQ
jgi:hypothetical protein|nr:MAG TPA: protein of unknown function (DUF4969) [Caudoviricetes sp.]